MTTPDDPTGPRELTAEEEREVSALLADLAAEPATTPPEVAARLDDVLAGLVADRTASPGASGPVPATSTSSTGGSVVPLEQRRRRLPRVLLAAAAVVVGGYAVGNLALDGSLDEMSGGSAGSDAAGGRDSQADRSQRETTGEALPRGEALSIVPIVRRDRLAADVRRVVGLFEDRRTATPPQEDEVGGDGGGDVVDETRDCPVPRLTDQQRLYEVRYQAGPAGLVVGPEEAGRVAVTVYSCRDGGVLVTRSVPAP